MGSRRTQLRPHGFLWARKTLGAGQTRTVREHGEWQHPLLAVGTGLDVQFFPSGRRILGIDISQKMLDKAAERVGRYDGELTVQQMDVHDLPFDEGHFDQVFTSCTFCSVPDPIQGLESLHRVLKRDGDLFMFEHTGSRYYPFKLMMDLMTPITRKLGPEMNRGTLENVEAAGFELRDVQHIYLDMVKTIYATA